METAYFSKNELANFQRAQSSQFVFIFRVRCFYDLLIVVIEIVCVEVLFLAFFVGCVICNEIVKLFAFLTFLLLFGLLKKTTRMVVDKKERLEISKEPAPGNFATGY